MLREAPSHRFEARVTLRGRRYLLVDGKGQPTAVWSSRRFHRLQRVQQQAPAALIDDGHRTWWWFEDRIYWEDDGLGAPDVVALVRDRERRRDRKLERAHAALIATASLTRLDGVGTRAARGAIPRETRRAVWERDGGRCVACGATFDLQYDHVIPLALGGSDSVENLQILCAPCNQEKGAAIA
ncbi:MAG: HNH endonuclease [Patulibacter sp.]|nr:HNH endonuclease [Patulibacter sp.]